VEVFHEISRLLAVALPTARPTGVSGATNPSVWKTEQPVIAAATITTKRKGRSAGRRLPVFMCISPSPSY
jgi:hypothetical protein